MDSKIIRAEAVYTGGGIYVGFGELENGLFFIADCDFDTVRILNADVFEYAEESWDSNWQDEHLVKDLGEGEFETVEFLWHFYQFVTTYCECPTGVWSLWQGLENEYKDIVNQMRDGIKKLGGSIKGLRVDYLNKREVTSKGGRQYLLLEVETQYILCVDVEKGKILTGWCGCLEGEDDDNEQYFASYEKTLREV